MSVINQMLKGLDKEQQQAMVESTGAVIVAAPKRHNKLVITLCSAIVIFAALAGYFFVQKQSRAENVNGQQRVTSSPVGAEEVIASDEQMISEELASQLVQKPILIEPEPEPEQAKPFVRKPVIANSAVAPVTAETKVVVARIEPPTPVRVKPSPVTAPKKPIQQVVPVTPAAHPTAPAEDEVVIKTVTRTPLQQAQLYAKQAEAALLAGDKANAKKLFSKVLSFDKQHDLAREKLAALLYGEQRTQSAVNLLQEGLSVSPEYTNFRLMLARIYLKNNNKQQAYYYLKPHQPQVAGNVEYYAILAGLAQSLDDLDTALVAYKKLTVHEPNRAKWWLGLGITADKAKQVGLALNAYHTAQNMGQLSASSRNYINARITQLEKQ
ncbi:tetratricopeptide repeat protein [Moritella sp. Urea-trap-13]|uniref:tetratricopeptide repeat protein n=1 Tax=Moritella sp. Urea-trap-13 TaxID=2058327 RepID=UPI000C3247A6|nr:tetratricopeptide repeat protein [Moritella sp. Urea-trap-13]PKH05149.1 MSHA biogenesis protein MshN [Moritella sp. Urea-trap-13]